MNLRTVLSTNVGSGQSGEISVVDSSVGCPREDAHLRDCAVLAQCIRSVASSLGRRVVFRRKLDQSADKRL